MQYCCNNKWRQRNRKSAYLDGDNRGDRVIFLTTLCAILFWAVSSVSVYIFLSRDSHDMSNNIRIGVLLGSLFWVCLYLGFKLLEVATLLNDSGLASW